MAVARLCGFRKFELPGEDAIMRKESARLIIEPTAARSLLSLLKTLSPIEYDFAPFDDPPATPVDLWLSYLLDTNIAPVDPPDTCQNL
jgi:antitoxin VapB